MLRSMFSGVSGLKVHQQKMDVIGNNIANVNTTAYKSGSITFQEVFSQSVSSASQPTEGGLGGTNPQQIGLGVDVGTISNQFEQGSIQRTSNPFDFAIDGDGFFVVSDGSGNQYTRAGNFSVDVEGNLVTSGGSRVQGWNYDLTTGEVDTTGEIEGVNLSDISIAAQPTTEIEITGNLDSNLEAYGTVTTTMEVTGSDTNTYTVELTMTRNPSTYNQVDCTASIDGNAAFSVGPFSLDDNGNIDATAAIAFTDANAGIPAGVTASITETELEAINADGLQGDIVNHNMTVYDSLGVAHTLTISMEKTDSNEFDYTVKFNGTLLTDAAGNLIGNGSLVFNEDGSLNQATRKDIVIDAATLGNGAATMTVPLANITFDSNQFTQFANDTDISMGQDGYPAGEMLSYSVDQSGQAIGTFSNGKQIHIATVAVASFINDSGLEKVGDSQYVSTWNSGDPNIGVAGTNGRGTISTLALEMSNVDLSSEFTEMIVAQRGFQANSRIITTSDEILQELVNLKR